MNADESEMSETTNASDIMWASRDMANLLEANGIDNRVTAAALLACATNFYVDKVGGVEGAPGWLQEAVDQAEAVRMALDGHTAGAVQ